METLVDELFLLLAFSGPDVPPIELVKLFIGRENEHVETTQTHKG